MPKTAHITIIDQRGLVSLQLICCFNPLHLGLLTEPDPSQMGPVQLVIFLYSASGSGQVQINFLCMIFKKCPNNFFCAHRFSFLVLLCSFVLSVSPFSGSSFKFCSGSVQSEDLGIGLGSGFNSDSDGLCYFVRVTLKHFSIMSSSVCIFKSTAGCL